MAPASSANRAVLGSMAVLSHYRRRSVQRSSSRSCPPALVPGLEGGRMSITEKLVTSVAALEALYDAPPWAAVAKETDTLIAPYRAFIELAPYLTLATVGADGVDCSPRGDAPGFVRILDEKTLLIPNRNGNNRIESLRNIVGDPRVAIHFLIPGCAESLRLKGR